MTQYAKEYTVTTTGSNEAVALDFPGRCTIKKVQVINLGGGDAGTDFYSRAFAGPSVAVDRIVAGTGGKARVLLRDFLPVRVGDAVTLASTEGGAYDATVRVTKVYDDPSVNPAAVVPVRTILTDASYTADKAGGTATTVVPSAERPLYKVASVAGTGVQATSAAFDYANQDPPPKRNIGVPRKIYAVIAAAGTYRIAILADENVAMGG